jgi:hypothetical protein
MSYFSFLSSLPFSEKTEKDTFSPKPPETTLVGDENFSKRFAEELDLESSTMESSNTIHDRTQFQAKFDYELPDQKNQEEKHYEIDFYLFIPLAMGIHSQTYSSENFYHDLTNYLRIRTPDLVWLKPKTFYIPSAEKYFNLHLPEYKRKKLANLVIQEVKLFGCAITSQSKKLQDIFKKALKSSNCSTKALTRVIRRELRSIDSRLDSFRQDYIQRIEAYSFLIDIDVQRVFYLVNEYISYQFENVLILLLEKLTTETDAEWLDLYQELKVFFEKETQYRQVHIFKRLERVKEEQMQLETRYFRVGQLKKYLYEILYLQIKNIKKDKTYRNIIAALGAALAASWAAVANLQQIHLMNKGELGVRLFAIFGLGVIAYVLKDRIKELSREYFNAKFKKFLPDYNTKMHYEFFEGEGDSKKIYLGQCRQIVRYVQENSISPEILYIRNMDHRSPLNLKRMETLLHYTKKVTFQPQAFSMGEGHIHQVKDVVRFNLNDFLKKLSDPNQDIRYYSLEKGVLHQNAPKVYHLNVIFRYTITSHSRDPETHQKKTVRHSEYERVRIVLNKKGIVRLEEVLPRGELYYKETKKK